jgi:quinoprotein glucose dehydrogenase
VKVFCHYLMALIILAVWRLPVPAEKKKVIDQRSLLEWLKFIDQGKDDPRLKGYLAPEGIKVEIIADYPVVVNPVGMTFGDDGTLYVLEWRPFPGASCPEVEETIRYRDGTTRSCAITRKVIKDARGRVKEVYKDRVKVLRDTKGKGVYDEAKVILEDELPSRILLYDGWLYLSGRGTVRRFKQSKAGGPYDVREVVARGFSGAGTHQVSGMTIGNEGWLYITCGDGDNFVEGSDGSRAAALRTGAVFRCRPDGSKIRLFSIGYRNPYGNGAFDSAFNMFQVDSGDGSKSTGCRLIHVGEESDFGWRQQIGTRRSVPDRVRGNPAGELPGKMPALLSTGRGASGGLVIYNDTRFPEPYRGLLYNPDPERRLIRAFKVNPNGASFGWDEDFVFLKSNDPLFRPCQMVIGPDGALYVCDWRSASGGLGQLWGDNKHGRIYRLSWAGTGKKNKEGEEEQPALPLRNMDSWAKIAKLSDQDLLKTLANESFSLRRRAQWELIRRGEKHRPALLKLLADTEESLPARLAALGVLQSFWNKDVLEGCCKLLGESDADLRRLGADALSLNCPKGDRTAHNELVALLEDAEPEVRRAAALAIGRLAAPGAADALINAFKFDNGKDRFLHDGLIRAIERLGKGGLQKLLDLGDSGVARDRDKVVETFRALRTAPAIPFLDTLLRNPHLSADQRAGLVRSYGNYLLSAPRKVSLDPSIPLKPMLAYLTSHPKEDRTVKEAGVAVLASFALRGDEQARSWLLSLLAHSDAGLNPKDLPLQRAAVAVLGLDPAGVKIVAERLLAKKLPRELRPEVAAALRKHAPKNPRLARLLGEVERMGGKPERK